MPKISVLMPVYNKYKANPSISIILNLYKRPENLKLQLEALQKQTIKPCEILLYQDGTSDTIKIPDDVKDEFDFIEINDVNKGVWERFRFAYRQAKGDYICVFDDDTIPGIKWLENCYKEMRKKVGLYGTIGVILQKPKDYPYCGSFLRVGWDGNLNKTVEVDFVGHSWFFKKEHLKYLFDAPLELQSCKHAGEDMAFSYELQKHGIKTFVPPHPSKKIEMFGSIPEMAWKLGTSKEGISVNNDNLKLMNEKINILLNSGWKVLIDTKSKYIRNIENKLQNRNSFKEIIQGIFSIKNSQDKLHKIITILGVKLSIKTYK